MAAFLSFGFRPLYLLGTAWAAISIALWIFAPQLLQGPLGGAAWHAHEMLWGFVATIAVGFLMTAGANWTGINPLHGRPLAGRLRGVAGRARGLPRRRRVSGVLGRHARRGRVLPHCRGGDGSRRDRLAQPAQLRGAAAPRRTRRERYLYLAAAWRGRRPSPLLMQRLQVGMLCMALVALLVAPRDSVLRHARGSRSRDPMHEEERAGAARRRRRRAIAALLGPPLAAGAGARGRRRHRLLWQVFAWKPQAVRGLPLLWILYVGYAASAKPAARRRRANHAARCHRCATCLAHLIAMAGFSVIIGMVTRAALGISAAA